MLFRSVNDVGLCFALKDHSQVLTVRYEDLIYDFEKTMYKIYAFIKEEVPESLTDWKNNTSIKKSKHWGEPVQDLHSNSILRWQKPEFKKRLDEFMDNAEAVSLLKAMGYE